MTDQNPSASPSLDALRPARKYRVIDLVRAAGLDVSSWSDGSLGEAGAASNPKFCYEWVFAAARRKVSVSIR